MATCWRVWSAAARASGLGLLAASSACSSNGARIVSLDAPASPAPATAAPPVAEAAPTPPPATAATDAPPRGETSETSAPPAAAGNPGVPLAPSETNAEFVWHLPPGFPPPIVPLDNPMSPGKVELGRHLFYDERLSSNETTACATCHRPELAFSDGRAVSVGSTGESHTRGAMSLANVAYATTLTWSHPYLTELERQVAVPMFGEAPVELGFGSEAEVEARLRSIAEYAPLFARAFPDEPDPIGVLNVGRALAAFERTLISGRSAYDRWVYDGDESALSESARRGFELFYSERLECFHCHLGFTFSDQVRYTGQAFATAPFHNTGLYDIDGSGAYPAPNTGLHDVTRDPADMGKFKAPSLRNIAVTAPYMHDGSIATLSEVLDHYAAGGRSARAGTPSPLVSDLIRGFELSEAERGDVLAFLESLTDEAFLADPAHQDPWTP